MVLQKDLQLSVAPASESQRQQSPLPPGVAAKESTIHKTPRICPANREAFQVTCQSSMGRLFSRAPEMTLHDHLLVSADGHSRCVPVAMNVPGVLRRRQGTRSLLSASEMTVVPTRTVDVRQRVSAMIGDRRALATRHLRRGLLGGTRRRHLYAAVHEPVYMSEIDDATNTAEVARVHLVEVVQT